jgi:hypothetical protein
MKLTALCMVLCVVVLLAGCPGAKPGAGGSGASQAPGANTVAASNTEYPVPSTARPYQKVHKSVEDAWFLVESGYFVIKDKYDQASKLMTSQVPADIERGVQQKNEVTAEIQRNIFQINPKIDQLFKDAITAEPENPLNYAAYAYYLKARKRMDAEGKYVSEGEKEARENIDKAIALWPDDSGFYLLKIHILSAPNQCHEWVRGAAGEELVLASRLEELRSLFEQAQKYDPDNAYINYYHAVLFSTLVPPDQFSTIRDEVYKELVAGNKKWNGRAYFPPPLSPYAESAAPVKITEYETTPVYYDQWSFFGIFAENSVKTMLDMLMQDMQWPQDKDKIKELMFAVYKLGAVKPLSYSYFSLQMGILMRFQEAVTPNSQDAFDLGAAARFLNQQYLSLANDMLKARILENAKQLDVAGIEVAERRIFRRETELGKFQKRQAAYLLKMKEVLGIDLDLPDDPKQW